MSKNIMDGLYKYIRENVSESEIEKAGIQKVVETKVADTVIIPKTLEDRVNELEQKVKEVKEPKDTDLEAATRAANKSKEDEINKAAAEKKNEGKIPAEPAKVDDTTKQTLTEDDKQEIVLGEFSDEQVAKNFATSNKGAVSQDPETKKWVVTSMKESKKEDEAAAAVTKMATSLLRKIHKAADIAALEDIMNNIEKTATSGKISGEQETRLKAALARRKEALEKNPTAPETEPTAKEEEEIEEEKKEEVQVKEDVDVTIKTEDKEVNIVSTEGGTQITTLDTPSINTEVVPIAAEVPVVEEPVAGEEPKEEELPIEAKKEEKVDENIEVDHREGEDYADIIVNGSRMITVYNMKGTGRSKGINWPGIGTSSIAKTEEFILALQKAIEVAKKLGVTESKEIIKESADDFTWGYAESVKASLKTLLGTDVTLERVAGKLKSMDRIGLDALKTAMENKDVETLKKFLNILLESKE